MKKTITMPLIFSGVLLCSLVVMATPAFAITAPSSGEFLYDLYDIAVNKLVKGAVGFVGGVAAISYGFYTMIQGNLMRAVPAILGGAGIIKADTVVTSLGALLSSSELQELLQQGFPW